MAELAERTDEPATADDLRTSDRSGESVRGGVVGAVSFYGMLTILGYDLYYSLTDGGLGLPKSMATASSAPTVGLVYLSMVLGGWVADRLLGTEGTGFDGGVVVMFGHIALAAVAGLTGVAVASGPIALGPAR